MLSTVVLAASALLGMQNAEALNVNAWQSASAYPKASDYPESSLPEINSRPSTAISFSGGGSRSFTAAMGYLGGLNELGLIDKVRYIGGISGGSWAASVFTYAQNVTDDSTLLGEVVRPSEIVYDELLHVEPKCARSLTAAPTAAIAIKALKDKLVGSVSDAYCYGVMKGYHEPMGITPATRFSWSEATVSDIRKRNPELVEEPFLVPGNSNRPFMVIGSAIVGPDEGAPYPSKNHNFTLLEFTPLYVGQMRAQDVEYTDGSERGPHWIRKRKHYLKRIGGAVEPYAFSIGGEKEQDVDKVGPTEGLPEGAQTGVLAVPPPLAFMDLAHAAGASGYAPGAFFESSHFHVVDKEAGMHFSYWSPTSAKGGDDTAPSPAADDMLITDGGCYENEALLPFLQRQVKKIVLFISPHTALQPAANWDVAANPDPSGNMDDNIAAFFGVFSNDKEIVARNFDLQHDQVFPTDDYVRVVQGLQAAQKAGNGAIATFNLVTVDNPWWGIAAGFEVELTIAYLSRLGAWEASLSPEMQSMVVPNDGDASDYSNTIDSGDFKHFPHYITAGGLLSPQQTNLLADMTGWSVLQNKELFERIFS